MLSTYRLSNKLADEKIIKVVRRDVFILFKKIIFFALLAVLPLAFLYIMAFSFPLLLNGTTSLPLIILAASAYYLFVWLFFFFSFIDYYLDFWIITDKRIIDVSQQGFFSRKISELTLNRVQDVTSHVQGFTATILKFGNLDIQTAAEKEKFTFEEISNPEGVRDVIIELAHKAKGENV